MPSPLIPRVYTSLPLIISPLSLAPRSSPLTCPSPGIFPGSVLELFTFVRSGGEVEQIVLKPLREDSAHATITALDIAKADCFRPQDRHRILAIVEASYGSFSQFNSACRSILLSKSLGKSATGKLEEGKAPRRSMLALKEVETNLFDGGAPVAV